MSEWVPVKGFEDLYQVNREGEVRSICGRYGENIILKQCVGSSGYLLVSLCRNGKQKTVNVHRLIAEAFLPNPKGLPCVNHKDGNRQNNDVSNLEWCSYYQNNIYGDRLTRSALKIGKPVVCVETGKTYPSARAAERATGILQPKISSCCVGKRKTAGSFHWSFVHSASFDQ